MREVAMVAGGQSPHADDVGENRERHELRAPAHKDDADDGGGRGPKETAGIRPG